MYWQKCVCSLCTNCRNVFIGGPLDIIISFFVTLQVYTLIYLKQMHWIYVIISAQESWNSACADKLHDTFVQMQWCEWSTNMPLPTCYNAEFGRSTLQDVGMNIENPKIGTAGTLFSGDGRRGWSSDTHPSPTCVNEVKFRSSVTKGVCINRTEPPKLGIAGAPAPAWGHDYPHKYDASYICWNCRIWSF